MQTDTGRPGQKSRPRVVLLGWYGSDNTGDEAVLEAVAAALRGRGFGKLTAMSTDPGKTRRRANLEAVTRNPFSPRTLLAVRGADALVMGGGGLIQDRTSLYNLPLYALHASLARALGKPVICWGLGVEPLLTPLGRLLARAICRLSAHFSVRDEISRELLRRAGCDVSRVRVTADPAFLLTPPTTERRRDPNQAPRIVFCLRDLPDNRPGLNAHYLLPMSVRRRIWHQRPPAADRLQAFVGEMGSAVAACVKELGAEVAFLALWPGRDHPMIALVKQEAEARGADPGKMSVLDTRPCASDVISQVGNADLLVSMRLHAMIFAAAQGVPIVALAYARKVRGLVRLLHSEQWALEVERANPSAGAVWSAILDLWQRREEQTGRVFRGARAARERAERDADHIAALIREAAGES